MTMKLLNPGPVTLTARVRAAFAGAPDICHREPEFAMLCRGILSKLARLYPEGEKTHVPILLTGSGTAAVEAMLGSLTPRSGRTLVVANGIYGERAAAMLEVAGKAFDLLRGPWLAPIDMAEVERRLAGTDYTHVFAVHHETTTGRLNRIADLGALCRRRGVPLLLDAVSSFGGEELHFDTWNLEACAATANKCLHAVPGIAFVLARKDTIATRPTGATSVYLDLLRYEKEQRAGFSPFTQATHVLHALDVALDELADQGGVPARIAHYRKLTALVLAGLERQGITPLLADVDAYAATLTSYVLPTGLTYDRLHDGLKQQGFVIYAGQGEFLGRIFRIAVMGDIDGGDIERLLACIERIRRG